MINETNILKCIHEKDYIKAKYLIVSFLRYICNTLYNTDNTHDSKIKQFTITSDLIFYLLNTVNNENKLLYTTWRDYSKELTNCLEDVKFPKYLKSRIHKISDYHYSSPIMTKISNERVLLKIVEKLLEICFFGNNNVGNDNMNDTPTIAEEEHVRNICKYFDISNTQCNVERINKTIGELFKTVGDFQSFNVIISFFQTVFRDLGVVSLDECKNEITRLLNRVNSNNNTEDDNKKIGLIVKLILKNYNLEITRIDYDAIFGVLSKYALNHVKSIFLKEERSIEETSFVNEMCEVNKMEDDTDETLTDLIRLCGGENLRDAKQIYEHVSELYTVTGLFKITQIVQEIKSVFSETTLIQAVFTIRRITEICGDGSLINCCKVAERVLTVCGVSTIENVLMVVERLQVIHTSNIDDSFSFSDFPKLFNSLIGENNTDDYDYIPGATNSEKLKHLHENLTEELKSLAPTLTYGAVIDFLKDLMKISNSTNLDDKVCKDIIANQTRIINLVSDTSKSRISNLIRELTDTNEEIKNLKQELTLCQTSLLEEKKKENNFEKLEQENGLLKSSITDLQENNKTLESDKEKLSSDLEQSKSDILHLKRQVVELEQTIIDMSTKTIKVAPVRPRSRTRVVGPGIGDTTGVDSQPTLTSTSAELVEDVVTLGPISRKRNVDSSDSESDNDTHKPKKKKNKD